MSKNIAGLLVNQMDINEVIEIAKELIEKNRIVNIEQIYNTAIRQSKFNKEGLKLILNYLYENRILMEGTKILKSNVLSNDTRELIFKFIKRYPGVNYSALKNNLFSEFDLNDMKMGNGQVTWHLEVLLKFKWIKKLKFKNYVIYFPFEMEPQHAKFYFLLRNKINREIISNLLKSKSLRQADIPELINESKGNVYYHIKVMIKEKIINSQKKEGDLEIKLNQNIEDIITKIFKEIMDKLLKSKERVLDIERSPMKDQLKKEEKSELIKINIADKAEEGSIVEIQEKSIFESDNVKVEKEQEEIINVKQKESEKITENSVIKEDFQKELKEKRRDKKQLSRPI